MYSLTFSSDKENVHSDEEKVKNEVANDREIDVEEKDKLERPEKDDILDENGNEEQVGLSYESLHLISNNVVF